MSKQFAGRLLTGRHGTFVLLTLILITAASLRLYDLDRTSLWYDEAVSWSQSNGSFGDLLGSVAADNYPPLHNILLWVSIPVLGDSETALRVPSAMLGILAVLLMFPLGEVLAGRSAGLLAAALLALSPFHIWYSTEARMYALLASTGLAFLIATLKVLRNPTGGWLLALVLTGALFLYSHIYALLGIASTGLVCASLALRDFVSRRNFRSSSAFLACLAMAGSALLFSPWLVILTGRARSVADEGFWIAYPDLPFLHGIASSMSGSLVLFSLLAALALFCLVRAQLQAYRDGPAKQVSGPALVCAAYTFGPPLLAYLYSILVQPILFDRYLIAAWPGVLLLASAAAQRLLPNIGPLALLAAALFLTFPELKFTVSEKIRPEWRMITQDYLSRRRPGDRLILYKGFAAPALAYYLRDPDAFITAESTNDLQNLAKQDRWLLIVHSNDAETTAATKALGMEDNATVAQRFGWGASGLRLVHRSSVD